MAQQICPTSSVSHMALGSPSSAMRDVTKIPVWRLAFATHFATRNFSRAPSMRGCPEGSPLPVALGGYEEKRNAASMQLYHENAYQAQFKPVPEDLLAIREDQQETNRFYLARQGMIPAEEFFNSDNLQRLRARVSAGRGGMRYRTAS
jgi:hypothetical protein